MPDYPDGQVVDKPVRIYVGTCRRTVDIRAGRTRSMSSKLRRTIISRHPFLLFPVVTYIASYSCCSLIRNWYLVYNLGSMKSLYCDQQETLSPEV